MSRIIGELGGTKKGPLIILIGGLHGNELTGIKAIERVFNKIREDNLEIHGKIIGLKGNKKAIEKKERYIDYDLNRCWTEEHIQHLSESHYVFAEDEEVLELNSIFEELSSYESTKKVCVDLHTTSSDNGNFIVVPELTSDDPVINALKLPLILDLEKHIKGTLLKYLTKMDFLAFAFEGGLIGSEVAVELHTAGIWEIMLSSGAVSPDYINGIMQIGTLLQTFASELPHKLRVRHHYWITEQDNFRMKPGYLNFQKVKAGEVIAHDRNGPIQIPMDGLIFMPLYQRSGNDGFFVVEELDPLKRIDLSGNTSPYSEIRKEIS
jgi:succinylglutamate desuccinylase